MFSTGRCRIRRSQRPPAQPTLMNPMELHLPGRPQVESGLVLCFPHTSDCIRAFLRAGTLGKWSNCLMSSWGQVLRPDWELRAAERDRADTWLQRWGQHVPQRVTSTKVSDQPLCSQQGKKLPSCTNRDLRGHFRHHRAPRALSLHRSCKLTTLPWICSSLGLGRFLKPFGSFWHKMF